MGGADRSQRPPSRNHRRNIRHALRNLIAVADDRRDVDVTLFLGPDRAVNLIEVGVLDTDDGPLIIHAMPARSRRFQPPKE